MVAAAGLALGASITGCSVAPTAPGAGPELGWYRPWVLNQSPDRIAMRWYPDTTTQWSATLVAQAHCARTNRTAVLVSDARDGSDELAEYHCR